ncbi:MAG: DUF502 domain-containing protein [Candidatus Saganbacteria bacterium]|nr:DUF502 domain-containing protein [Candidatus Saganbacteria bacterium]
MWAKLSSLFFRGVIILLPLFITIWLLWFMFSFMDGILGGILSLIFGHPMPGLGFIITISLILFTGYLANYLIGERFFHFIDNLLIKVPIVKTIYSSAKQVNDALFQTGASKGFTKACLIEYPRTGVYSIGFLTSRTSKEISKKTGHDDLVNVFIPNTPTPATGFLVLVPQKDVIMLDIKTEDAVKMIVSAGVLQPKERK